MENFLKEIDVWVWRYRENTRNYPGIHMTARESACEALLRCLEVLEAEGPSSKRTMPLRNLDPDDEAKITGGQRFVNYRKLMICLTSPDENLKQFCIGLDGAKVFAEFTPARLYLLREGIEDIRKGVGDYAIGPELKKEPTGPRDRESLDLWFWPCFGHLHPIP